MVRRAVRLFVLVLVGIGVGMAVKSALAARAPRRSLDGSGPVLGSLDTWPPVPRKDQPAPG